MGAAVDESGSCARFKGCLSAGRPRLVSGGTPSDDTHGNDPARRMCEPPIGRDATKRARSGGLCFEQN